jgi:Methane oxygenase PmoA
MTSVELRCGTRTVGSYVHQPELPSESSPRPYFHPLTTFGGVRVTEVTPPDHRHHLGAGLAVPDVAGRNFWGGRTFVRGRGPTLLDNHGTQRHLRWHRGGRGDEDGGASAEDGFRQDLAWTAGGEQLLAEQRTVGLHPLSPRAWVLDVAFTLTNTIGRPLRIASPAVNGRPGAGYGGFFWRAPKENRPPHVFTAAAEGEQEVHGSRAPWLAMTGDGWSLLFSGTDPWFVRTREYPGVGSSLAWDRALTLPAAGSVTRRVVTVVADGRIGPAEAAALHRRSTTVAGALPGAATGPHAPRPERPPPRHPPAEHR